MQAHFPEVASVYAQDGTCQHELGADLIYKPGPAEKYVGVYTLADVLVTEEHYKNAKIYADHVRSIAGDGAHLEETISAPTIHPESFGTCDAWFYCEATRTLYVWDFKSGFARVSAFENWQLINYAAGLIFNPNCPASNAARVVLVIVQPRDFGPDGPIKEWSTTIEELEPYFKKMKISAQEVFSEKPQAKNGRHCQYCKARHACEAKRLGAFDAFEYICASMPRTLSPEQIGAELEVLVRAKEEIDYRLTGLQTQVEALIKDGKQVPQWDLRSKAHRKEWKISGNELDQIAQPYKIELTKKVPITPKQAIDAGLPAELVNAFTTVKPGKKYLVPYDKNQVARKLKNGTN
jgi:hypothetical protein